MADILKPKDQGPRDYDPEVFNELWTEATQFILQQVSHAGYAKESHAFFYVMLANLRRHLDPEFKAPAAVGFTAESPQGRLWVNPADFAQDRINIMERAGLLIHEVLHIVGDHLHYDECRENPKMWNVAADCAINQQVDSIGYKLPQFEFENPITGKKHTSSGITPKVLGELFKCAPPTPNKDALFYWDWLKEKVEELKKNLEDNCPGCQAQKNKQDQDENGDDQSDQGDQGDSGDGGDQDGGEGGGNGQPDPNATGDSSQQSKGKSKQQGQNPGGNQPQHSCRGRGNARNLVEEMLDGLSEATNHDWQDMTPEEREIIRKFEAQATKSAVENSDMHEGSTGLPGDIAGNIFKKLKALESQIDWTKELHRFVGGIGKVTPTYRRNRMNKYDLPGKYTYFPGKSIAVVTDESGSVGDNETQQFLAEITQIDQSGCNVFRVMTDCAVNGYGWVSEDPTLLETRAGFGGTSMKVGLDFIDNLLDEKAINIGGVVVLTDGELPACDFLPVGDYPVPILYIFTRKSSKPPSRPFHGEVIYFEKPEAIGRPKKGH